MDGHRFDHLTRTWATRRTAIGGLLAGLAGLAGLDVEAKKKRKHAERHTGSGKSRHQDALRAEKKKKKKKKCKGGTLKCGKVCVNASTDAQNCGTCGRRCTSGAACVNGVCKSPSTTCPTGQVRCNGQCVDPMSNEAHCGGCGQACQGDLTCLSGTCGCDDSADTQCGASCVNLQDDDDHCGTCGAACQGNLTCQGGACGCAAGGDSQCGNLCVDTQSDEANCGSCGHACGAGQSCQGGQCVDAVECTDQYGCGGYSYNDLVCRNGRCVCADANKGICQRYPDKRGRCHVCCPGGSGQCLRDEVCHLSGDSSNYFALCDCPTGWDRCTYNYPTGTCTEDWDRDPRKCGQFCTDCQANLETNPKATCCNGFCVQGCSPGTIGSGCYSDSPCGPNCLPCGEGKICCNMGPGTEPRCIPNVNGFCYLN